MRLWTVAIALVAMVAASCGGDGGDVDAGLRDPATAQDCAELAEMGVESAQNVLDALGSVSQLEDFTPEQGAAFNEYSRFVSGRGFSGSGELCESGEYYRLVCEATSNLEAFGPEGEEFRGDVVAPCPVDTDGDVAASDSGDSFLDEPFPTVAQLENAADCDELNRFMAGVENENFRVNTHRTVAEEDAEAEDEYEDVFDVYDIAFSDRQGEFGCSDAEMMSVLERASDERCRAWVADGHLPDEDPLLLNTAFCLG